MGDQNELNLAITRNETTRLAYRTAVDLLSEHGENIEYDRALSEVVTDIVGLSIEKSPAMLDHMRQYRKAMR